MSQCPQCSTPVPDPAPRFCLSCGFDLEQPPALPAPPVPASGPSWEGPAPFGDRLIKTTVAVLTEPTAFFRQLPPTGVNPAVMYALLVGGVTVVAATLIEMSLQLGLG